MDEFPSTQSPVRAGKPREGPVVLVTYATGFGTTAEVAAEVAKTIESKVAGARSDVKPLREIVSLEGYEAVIIGSPIRYDRWMSEARNFAIRHQKQLSAMPVAGFFTCLVLSKPGSRTGRKADAYAEKVAQCLPNVDASSIGRFAGVLDYGQLSLVPRALARGVFALLGVKEGDHRDWSAIRAWSAHALNDHTIPEAARPNP